MFSRRTNWPVGANKITAALEAKKKAGHAVLDLTESNPARAGLRYPERDLLETFRSASNLRYEPDPKGLAAAREAVAAYYLGKGRSVSPGEIILTSGTSEAYAHLFRLLLDPGDEILVPSPGYPLLDYLADLHDIGIVRYPLELKDGAGWRIPTGALAGLESARARAVIVVNPNNPTGNFVREQEKKELCRLCAARSWALVSDEVFSDYVLDPGLSEPASFAADPDVLSFTLGGVSKALALPQMKLSWIVLGGPAEARHRALERLEIIADTFLSVNTPAQNALPLWFELGAKIRALTLERLRTNARYLTECFRAHPAAAVQPIEGGWYAVIRLSGAMRDEKTAMDLLERHNVLVHPGYFFDFRDEGYLVISLLVQSDIFRSGADILSGFLKDTVLEA